MGWVTTGRQRKRAMSDLFEPVRPVGSEALAVKIACEHCNRQARVVILVATDSLAAIDRAFHAHRANCQQRRHDRTARDEQKV